jgi:hypothetical protein
MDPALRLHPSQQALTPLQEAEARRFASERIQAQLSTEPVDEQEAEALLKHAYQVVGLATPHHISWVDGPLQLMAAPALDRFTDCVRGRFLTSRMKMMRSIRASAGTVVGDLVAGPIIERIRVSIWASVGLSVQRAIWDSLRESGTGDAQISSYRTIFPAYVHAQWLAWTRFFDSYVAPNAAHAWAHFNELVSFYRLGAEEAAIVRRPNVLSRDAQGRLHSATGRAIEYRDGWGFWAWHGVRVPEKVILAPGTLTREDFLNEPNAEVRRVIQERMGERFVPELGGTVLDRGPRGTLYEVALPDDPERVARYVQVQDASTARQYFLRVPPTVKTAAEAVAWSFNLSVEVYHPLDET